MNSTDGADWYIRRGATQSGPYPFSALIAAAEKGVVRPDDLIRGPGLAEWVRVADAAELLASPASASVRPTEPAPVVAEPTPVAVEPAAAVAQPAPTTSIATVATPPALTQAPSCTADAAQRGSYFARHWRGDLSLGVSYWINGVLASLLSIALVLAPVFYAKSAAPNDVLRVFIALVVIVVVSLSLITWQLVGIWRSASKHKSRGGRRGWAIAAQVMVIIAALRFLTDMSSTAAPMLVEYSKMLAGDEKFGKATLRLVRGGAELQFAGGINIGAAKEIEQTLGPVGKVKVLHLTSTGGRIAEADVIAQLVKQRALLTYVSSRCTSACTHIFLAGKERWIAPDARIGFHQPDFPGLARDVVARLVEDERQYLKSAGLPDAFIQKILSTPPNAVWVPSVAQLKEAGVITGVAASSDAIGGG